MSKITRTIKTTECNVTAYNIETKKVENIMSRIVGNFQTTAWLEKALRTQFRNDMPNHRFIDYEVASKSNKTYVMSMEDFISNAQIVEQETIGEDEE